MYYIIFYFKMTAYERSHFPDTLQLNDVNKVFRMPFKEYLLHNMQFKKSMWKLDLFAIYSISFPYVKTTASNFTDTFQENNFQKAWNAIER